jgi:hypothetical protein
MADIQLTGLDVVTQRLQEMATVVTPILGIALQQEADAILEVSQTLVPVLTSRLQKTGRVEDVQINGPTTSVDITYGVDGPKGPAPYARKQEFDTTLNHPRGGQAFYLGQPFWAAEQAFTQNLADALSVAL